MMKEPKKYLVFTDPAGWRAWLEENHATGREAWLLHYKKKSPRQTLTYEQAVEEALCFGWIDGLLRRIDDEKFVLRYTPRKPGSIWSETNKRRVERLISLSRMTAAGFDKIVEAKTSGEWDAATAREDVSAIPADLTLALEQDQVLLAFNEWPPSRKKQYLHWLNSAKREQTRRRRIVAIVGLAAGR